MGRYDDLYPSRDVVEGETYSSSVERDPIQAEREAEEAGDKLADKESQYRHLKWMAFLGIKGLLLGIVIMITGFCLGMISDSLFYIWVAGALLVVASVAAVVAVVVNTNPMEQYEAVAQAQRDYTRKLRRYHDTLPHNVKQQTAIEE